MQFHFHANQSHFHKNGFALRLALKQRHKGTRKWPIRGCLHDNGATFIPGRDEKLHRVYIKPCLLECESYSAVKLKKL